MEGLQEDLVTFCRAYRASMADLAGEERDSIRNTWAEDIFRKLGNVGLHRLMYWLICLCCGIETEVARRCELRLVADCSPGPNYARLGPLRVGAESLNASETFTISGVGLGFLEDQATPLN